MYANLHICLSTLIHFIHGTRKVVPRWISFLFPSSLIVNYFPFPSPSLVQPTSPASSLSSFPVHVYQTPPHCAVRFPQRSLRVVRIPGGVVYDVLSVFIFNEYEMKADLFVRVQVLSDLVKVHRLSVSEPMHSHNPARCIYWEFFILYLNFSIKN